MLGVAACGRETIDLAGDVGGSREGGLPDAGGKPAPLVDGGPVRVVDAGGASCTVSSDCPFGGVCSDATHRCVECVSAEQCTRPWARLCDTATSQCVGCLTASDCPAGVCDPTRRTCVECASDADCRSSPFRGPRNQRCVVGFCVQCATDKDCTAPESLCQPALGRCVECLSASDCVTGQTCDPFRGRCSP